jgi:hypothetical protein
MGREGAFAARGLLDDAPLEPGKSGPVVADTSADAHVAAYREAIRFYARDIERAWT